MTELMRIIVPKKKTRYTLSRNQAGSLELFYITDNVLAMSCPEEKFQLFSHNPINEVKKWLDTVHPKRYLIYNCAAECKYDKAKLDNRVNDNFAWGQKQAPSFDNILKFIADLNNWLSAHPQNVAIVHCNNGKERTGLLVCCWLLFSKKCSSASHAIQFFTSKRLPEDERSSSMSSLMNAFNQNNNNNKQLEKREAIKLPSYRRYVQYYEKFLASKETELDPPQYKFVKIRMVTIPDYNESVDSKNMWISINKNNKTLFTYKSMEGFSRDSVLEIECSNTIISGDISVEMYQKNFSNMLFRTNFHSAFLKDPAKTGTFQLALTGRDLDVMTKKDIKKYASKDFRLELIFTEIEKPRQITIEKMLATPKYVTPFKQFLSENHAEENMHFIEECDKYRSLLKQDNKSAAAVCAKAIADKFFTSGSSHELNIAAAIKKTIMNNISSNNLTDNLFQAALKEVVDTMRADIFRRFLVSNLWIEASRNDTSLPFEEVHDSHSKSKSAIPTATCVGCWKPITSSDLGISLRSQQYHVDCISCDVCHTKLSCKEIVFKQNRINCAKCSKEAFFPKCPICTGNITSKRRAFFEGSEFHIDCFHCAGCNSTEDLTYASNQLQCRTCIEKLLQEKKQSQPRPSSTTVAAEDTDLDKPPAAPLPMPAPKPKPPVPYSQSAPDLLGSKQPPQEQWEVCGLCNQSMVAGQTITIIKGKKYHCFCVVCTVCHQPITGVFGEKDGKYYCKKDWEDKFNPKCCVCGLALSGQFMHIEDKKYHLDCFKCCKCDRVLSH
eukprot:CAMPEP_0168573568 /NCGR_PEP_ID=MMETSP0413-20121227/18608_1 /TAXON_ID=136452 /ORGANISM="Filamoeba nolandi, Strain NC-AS-23-1" /LENGTH=779 /DNA_ID=CAMNT_0008606835 /DNA_START=37 /DNA_END=2373 /DNA_ORIENTATION=-